jgi:hypothetical protein
MREGYAIEDFSAIYDYLTTIHQKPPVPAKAQLPQLAEVSGFYDDWGAALSRDRPERMLLYARSSNGKIAISSIISHPGSC